MPKIAEIKEINGEVWVRVGKVGDFPSGVSIMSPEEIEAQNKEYSKAPDEKDKLLPCAHCGSMPKRLHGKNSDDTARINGRRNDYIQYQCSNRQCWLSSFNCSSGTEGEAIKRWNTRATTDLIEQLCGALEFYRDNWIALADWTKGLHRAPNLDLEKDEGARAKEALSAADKWRRPHIPERE